MEEPSEFYEKRRNVAGTINNPPQTLGFPFLLQSPLPAFTCGRELLACLIGGYARGQHSYHCRLHSNI